MDVITMPADDVDELAELPPDWDLLREHRSPWWRPGMATLVEPWAAMAETSHGYAVQLFGRDAARARARVARWQLIASRNDGWVDGRLIVAAALIDPRGDVVEGWRTPGAQLPNPHGESRWTSLRQIDMWTTCTGCKARRWPGCWMERSGDGCALCAPARETADPRPWPVDPPCVLDDPALATKGAKR